VDAISVFIADDHEFVRYAIRSLLDTESGIVIAGEAEDAKTTLAGCVETHPDVLVLDLEMPGALAVDVCREVRAHCPLTAVIVLATEGLDADVFGMLDAGASGYLLKDTHAGTIVEAIRCVADGQSVFEHKVADTILAGRHQVAAGADAVLLSARETEVLRLLAEGHSNKDVGRMLWISETTVKTHVSHILHKLGAADRTQAVLIALRKGLVSVGD